MTRIIPRKLIEHLEWTPGQEPPQHTTVNPTPQTIQQRRDSIVALINTGRPFYSNGKDSIGNDSGTEIALRAALNHAGSKGVVASMPYLIAGKVYAYKSNYLWKTLFDTLTEENVGIDEKGKLVKPGEPVVITVHGGGILTPERIRQTYEHGESLTEDYAAKFKDEEFADLLNGVLPSDESIELYTVDDVKEGSVPDPFGRYAVWMSLETAKTTTEGYQDKSEFMNNPLVIARAGSLDYLETYFDKAKSSIDRLDNSRSFRNTDLSQPQGRLLEIGELGDLRGHHNLHNAGHFVGVSQ